MARTQQQIIESMLGNKDIQIAALVAQLEKTEEELATRNKQLSALVPNESNPTPSISPTTNVRQHRKVRDV